jgi:hypothetical protein
MKMTQSAGSFLGAGFILLVTMTLLGQYSPTVPSLVQAPPDVCEDSIDSVAAVDGKLDSAFFWTTKTSRPWHIIEHGGTLENTFGEGIGPDDLLLIEHTAQCTSTHQGAHQMEFCDAVKTKDGCRFRISGGMPARASDLTVTMDAKLNFKCEFKAVYPDNSGPLRWKVTKKTLKLKSAKMNPGSRMYGWISVELEERDHLEEKPRIIKVEGYFKPFLQSLPQEEGDEMKPK